jgi:beta-galactosidase
VNAHRFQKLFPLGTHLCREPMPPMQELERDMENAKRHGFNLIKLQEHWAVDEPEEGSFDFSRCHELMERAARLDLGVYLGLTCEQAPPWLWEKHPGCRMVDREGRPVAYEATFTLPADGKPGPCYDHDGAREDMLRFIRTLVEELGRHENLVVWNTWQEVGYWGEAFVGSPVCYCPSTIAFFRTWLEEKYGDLDALNRAWNSRYLAWERVAPDRCRRKTCLPNDVDWNHFMDHVQIGRVLAERCRVIKESDPLGRPVFAHRGAPALGSGVDWAYARCQDWLGSSCYPAWGPIHAWDDARPAEGERFDAHDSLLSEVWDSVALRFDYLRSCNGPGRPVWAAEFQGGPVDTGLHRGRVPSAADMRRWMLTAVGSGVSGISFWVTRAEIAAAETNGFSLLDSEGESSERYEEASRIGEALGRRPELFGQPTLEPARAAILVDDANWQLCRAMEGASEHLAYSLRGWHRLLWELGVPVDFVEASALFQQAAPQHRLMVLPFPLSISDRLVEGLEGYVRGGGTLASEACIGRLTEHAYANRGELAPAARALFGVRHRGLVMVREPGAGARWMPRERMWGEYREAALLVGTGPLAGGAVRANLYVETLECTSSGVALTYEGEPAGSVRTVGAGHALLIGTLVGHSGTAYRLPQTTGFVRKLLSLAGVEPAHSGELLVRRRARGREVALVVTNPTREPVTETVAVGPCSAARDLFGAEIEIVEGGVSLAVDSLDVRVVVVER